ncbi:MAG: DUF177 domain-containing protein [Bacteroidales bacterium]|nr:DUF177 domain-containing protein [Bacteroidales bacterium]
MVNHLKDFKIQFSGLPFGYHQYQLDADDKFFEAIEYSEVKKGTVKVDIELEKQERFLILNFDIDGTVIVPCDRCLDDLECEVSGQNRLIVKFGDEAGEESEDVVIIPRTDHQFDVSHLVYEYIILMLSPQRMHQEDENGNLVCDPEILARLRNENIQQDQDQGSDPRWDSLKGLKFED